MLLFVVGSLHVVASCFVFVFVRRVLLVVGCLLLFGARCLMCDVFVMFVVCCGLYVVCRCLLLVVVC